MTRIEIDFSKSLEENASNYFEKSKKAKAKAKKIKKAIKKTEKKLSQQKKTRPKTRVYKKRKRDWFEKFHWFYSSQGFLVIGGRNSQTNEQVVKKYMEKNDQYFHADISGAPHCIVKSKGKKIPKKTKEEAAQFAGIFSKAWSEGLSNIDVYSVKPEQVSKQAPSGESLGTGAFMIYGKRNWYKKVPMKIAMGIEKKERVISGPESAIKEHSPHYALLVQGRKKKGEIAKELRALFEKKLGSLNIHLDEFIAMLPAGESKIKNKP